MLINTQNLSALFTAYNAAFQYAFAGAEVQWQKISTEVPSSTEQNLYAWLGQFPKLREWLGQRVVKNMKAFNYTIINKHYESTVGVPRDKIEDDTYGVFTPLMAEMGYSAKLHPDELVFGLLVAGHTNLCYDGQNFLDTNHPIVNPTTGVTTTTSNYDGTADGIGNLWVLLDCKRPLKPMMFQIRKPYTFVAFNRPTDEHVFMNNEFLYGVDARCNAGFGIWQTAYGSLNTISAANYESYLSAMLGLKTDEGKPLGIRPSHVVIGPSRLASGLALFGTQLLTGGGTNPHFKEVEIVLTPYFS